MPLLVEILNNEYQVGSPFALASLLAMPALIAPGGEEERRLDEGQTPRGD